MERRCEYDPGFCWLMGLPVINHHTLSDFRLAHREALDEMFTQVLASTRRVKHRGSDRSAERHA
ncbi:transposase [Brucella pituitosa]|uniref:transposase n=1 Tax=Brucella pituitosa TaxID=571256 RepID=UPI003F4A98FD